MRVGVKGTEFGGKRARLVNSGTVLSDDETGAGIRVFEHRRTVQRNERGGFPTATVTPHSVYLLVTLFWYFVTGRELIRSVE